MVNNYSLVNPYIKGKIETNIKAKNSLEAANLIYTNLSEHFNNAVPNFYFTIQKGDNKLYHFKVSEKKNNNEINFNINQIELNNNTYINDGFKKKLENIKNKMNSQEGGDKKTKSKKKNKKKTKKKQTKSSDSDSDSDSDMVSSEEVYIKTKKYYYTEPIYYVWYDPLVYNTHSVYIPTFYSYATPYINVDSTIVSVPAW